MTASRARLLALLCAAGILAVPAQAKGPVTVPDEGPDPRGLTVSGTGFAHVVAPRDRGEAAIRRAVGAAKGHAYTRAVAAARVRAVAIAGALGLTLGEPAAVTERDPEAEMGYLPGGVCRAGTRCRVPLLSGATVAVTFATAQITAAQTTGRAVVASGVGSAPVRPRDPGSSASIRAALVGARVPADAEALIDAHEEAARIGAAARMTLGPVLAVAERHRPFDDPSLGSFGVGRFCGPYRRTVVRRDPRTGRRRAVRRGTVRRCFFSRTASVALRVTYAG